MPHSYFPQALGSRPIPGSSVQLSRSVVSDFLWPHGLQHARFPCPSPIPGVCSNSCPSSQLCHPTVSSSVSGMSCLFMKRQLSLGTRSKSFCALFETNQHTVWGFENAEVFRGTAFFLQQPQSGNNPRVHQQMNKQSVVHACNGIWLSHEKGWSPDTCHNMNEPWKHHVMWKAPDPKGQKLYDSIDTYRKHPKYVNS